MNKEEYVVANVDPIIDDLCAFFNSKKVKQVDALLAMIAMVGTKLNEIDPNDPVTRMLGMFAQDLLNVRLARVNAEVPVKKENTNV